MYTPINWANPHNLGLISEKKQTQHLEDHQVKKHAYDKKSTKSKLIDALTKSFSTKLKPSFGI